jgi:DNA-binding HxlR family transcriptional regulator
MIPPEHFLGTPAITENLLKRKWSVTILRYLHNGTTSPADIARKEPELSLLAMNERLRTLLRYGMIVRHPSRGSPREPADYRLTPKGQRILSMLELISQLDSLSDQDPRSLDEVLRSDLIAKSELPEVAPAPGRRKPAPPKVFSSEPNRIARRMTSSQP